MVKLGFLLSRLDDQLGFQLIASINRLLAARRDVDVVLFVANASRPLQRPACGIMNLHEAFDFDGIAVATDLDTASRLCRFPGPSTRLFYSWDLEWMRRPGFTVEQLTAIYHHPRLGVVARHADHKTAIERCWNRPVLTTIPDADAAMFAEVPS